MVNRALRTVGVPNLETVAVCLQFIVYRLERIGSLTCHQCQRTFVAVDTRTDEVVGTVIANLEDDIGYHFCHFYEVRTVINRFAGLFSLAIASGQRQYRQEGIKYLFHNYTKSLTTNGT